MNLAGSVLKCRIILSKLILGSGNPIILSCCTDVFLAGDLLVSEYLSEKSNRVNIGREHQLLAAALLHSLSGMNNPTLTSTEFLPVLSVGL